MNHPDKTNPAKNRKKLSEQEHRQIEEALSDIRYGSVLISVQDGKIVQIDKNEKFRFS